MYVCIAIDAYKNRRKNVDPRIISNFVTT